MHFEKSHRGVTDTWLTPPWIYKELGEFDLDPCAHPLNPTAKRLIVYPKEDGLKVTWEGRVWCNPPYGPQTGIWLSKLAAHGCGTALVAARTETRWLQNQLRIAKCALFIHGRITFLTPELKEAGNSTFPSVLLAYGDRDAEILFNCKIKGYRTMPHS